MQANNNLQAIYQRIQQKYAAEEARQAQLAAQAEAATNRLGTEAGDANRQSYDTASPGLTSQSTADAGISVDDSLTTSDDNSSRFLPGEELILTTNVNGLELTSLFTVKTERSVELGLAEFCQIMEFPIDVNLEDGSAEGWFINEKNRFQLKRLEDGSLQIDAKRNSFTLAPDAYRLGEDLYVELADLAQWFDLNYDLNEELLVLAITSPEKLPIELRLARQGNTNTNALASNTSVLPLKDSGYKAFSPPMLDIQTWAQENEFVIPATASSEEQKVRQTSASYSILASHDLAFLNSELFLSGNKEDALNNAWLTLSRQSDDADLLGPLRATEYAFGDVVPVNAGFGSTQGISRGLSFGNVPTNQLADNRKVNITGEIQVGWDVELYRNGILIDQRLGISEGRYEFNDTPLEYGNNDFQLIFYGPQGQRETKTESYIVDSNTVQAGEAMYRFSMVEVGESVFNLDPLNPDPKTRGLMASSVLDLGITDWLALNLGSSVFEPKEGETQEFVTLGTSASLGKGGLFSARFLQDKNDLQSTDYNYRTRLFNTSYGFNFRRSESLDLINDDIITTDSMGADMSGQLFRSSWLPISYQNTWRRSEPSNQLSRDEYFQNTIGIGSRFGHLSNSTTWYQDVITDPLLDPSIAQPTADSVLGSAQYRKNFGRLHTRLYANYGLEPTEEVFAYGGIFNYNWTSAFNSEVRYNYYTLADKYQVQLGLNWNKDAFYLSTNASYNEDGSWSAGLSLRFSLGYEPIEQSVFGSGRPIAQSGAVAVRVFEDLNMNGSFDPNEPPMENATVKAVQSYREEKTNASGVAVLSSLYNNTTTDIIVDESTLDGPFMISANPGVAIKARKGFVDQVELPVVKAGEVEGIIYQKDEVAGVNNPAPYIGLHLVDAKQNIVASTRSEFDGYYLFTKIKPGHYQLKVDEDYIDRRSLKSEEKKLDFSSEGDVIAGVDFVLRPLDEAQGYVAIAGFFETADMLKLYYHILRRKMGQHFVQTPFYIKKPNKGGFLLGLAYYPTPSADDRKALEQAQQACAPLKQQGSYCDPQYHDFKY